MQQMITKIKAELVKLELEAKLVKGRMYDKVKEQKDRCKEQQQPDNVNVNAKEIVVDYTGLKSMIGEMEIRKSELIQEYRRSLESNIAAIFRSRSRIPVLSQYEIDARMKNSRSFEELINFYFDFYLLRERVIRVFALTLTEYSEVFISF